MVKVTCAIIRNEDREVLIVQRPYSSDHPLKWEFPGGKVNRGETDEDCIIREIMEELSMDIVIAGTLPPTEFNYGIKHILLIPFICDTLDVPKLSEHTACKWIKPSQLGDVDFSGADIQVAWNYLRTVQEAEETAGTDHGYSPATETDKEFAEIISNMTGRKEAEWFANSAAGDTGILSKLIGFSFSDDKKVAFRASWMLTKIYDEDPGAIYPWLPEMIGSLDRLSSESVRRSFMKIISMSDPEKLDKEYHGILTEYCFGVLRSDFSTIAVKAYSMEILLGLAGIYPGLVNELAATINMISGEGSAGIKAKGRLVLKRLTGIT